jgi:hypothetical protein
MARPQVFEGTAEEFASRIGDFARIRLKEFAVPEYVRCLSLRRSLQIPQQRLERSLVIVRVLPTAEVRYLNIP